MSGEEYWYRLVDGDWSYVGDIYIERYEVLRHTPCGVWIAYDDGYGMGEKFVLQPSGTARRFAYPTMEQALMSYRYRKLRQVQHKRAELERAEAQLRSAENIQTLTPEDRWFNRVGAITKFSAHVQRRRGDYPDFMTYD